jgi:hypothetical protein
MPVGALGISPESAVDGRKDKSQEGVWMRGDTAKVYQLLVIRGRTSRVTSYRLPNDYCQCNYSDENGIPLACAI